MSDMSLIMAFIGIRYFEDIANLEHSFKVLNEHMQQHEISWKRCVCVFLFRQNEARVLTGRQEAL